MTLQDVVIPHMLPEVTVDDTGEMYHEGTCMRDQNICMVSFLSAWLYKDNI